jgi:hypothetical protein
MLRGYNLAKDPTSRSSTTKEATLPPPSRGRWNCLQASGDALVPGGAHPGIAILAGRELIWCDTRSKPLFALGVVDAESVRKGEMPRDHRVVHGHRDNDAGSLRAEAGVSLGISRYPASTSQKVEPVELADE